MTDTTHVSLNDELSRLNARIEEIEARDQELREAVADDDVRFAEEDVDGDSLDSVEDLKEWQEIDAEYRETRVKVSAYEDAIREFGGGDFTLKALDFGEVMRAKDQVQQASYDVNPQTGQVDGVPRDGYYKLQVLELGVVDAPAGAPDDPTEYPYRVGELLYERINRLTTSGGEDLENLSLAGGTD